MTPMFYPGWILDFDLFLQQLRTEVLVALLGTNISIPKGTSEDDFHWFSPFPRWDTFIFWRIFGNQGVIMYVHAAEKLLFV